MYVVTLSKSTPAAIRHNLVGRKFENYDSAFSRVQAVPSGIRMFMDIKPVNKEKG